MLCISAERKSNNEPESVAGEDDDLNTSERAFSDRLINALKISNASYRSFDLIVGYASHPSFGTPSTRTVIWYGGNGYLLDDLLAPIPDIHYTFAHGVNDKADVVGQLKKDSGVVQGFLVRP